MKKIYTALAIVALADASAKSAAARTPPHPFPAMGGRDEAFSIAQTYRASETVEHEGGGRALHTLRFDDGSALQFRDREAHMVALVPKENEPETRRSGPLSELAVFLGVSFILAIFEDYAANKLTADEAEQALSGLVTGMLGGELPSTMH